ncbi:MAG: response regulator transcription factor [Oscillospiraceae bacterium]|nr:response regulator transcription factor [Oscillospiraceae bacterium]
MIYCLEDDRSIQELMVYTLNASGYHARGFSESGAFWHAVQDELPELVLLDIMLPGEDGIAVLDRLRANPATEHIPVILETAKDTEIDKVLGLDAGADDYLAKPFGMMEMVARIKAVLRRTTPRRTGPLRSGGIELDETRHRVTANGRAVTLTLKEYELLKLLMENAGQVFSRDHLLSRLWGQDYVGETRTVDVHIGTLRTKLSECGAQIQTVRGVGYLLEASHEQ